MSKYTRVMFILLSFFFAISSSPATHTKKSCRAAFRLYAVKGIIQPIHFFRFQCTETSPEHLFGAFAWLINGWERTVRIDAFCYSSPLFL